MLLIVMAVIIWALTSEVIYRCKRRWLKKHSNLSEYGISETINRGSCYALVFAIMLISLWTAGVLWVIITKWNMPL